VGVSETDAHDLARRMVGSHETEGVEPARREAPAVRDAPAGTPVLQIRDLYVRDERGVDAVRGLALDVRPGEVFGVAGVDGNGQAELAEAIVGLRPVRLGRIEVAGADGRDAHRREIGYIPQDRRRDGLVLPMTVRDNLILELHQEPQASAGPWLRWDYLNGEAGRIMGDFDVRASGLTQTAGTLSGGNQQKIVIARALRKAPHLLVALNPTRGLDVGASAYVHEQLRSQRDRGAAILLISTELDEVSLADRIGVLYEGQLVGIVPPDTGRDVLGLMMGGKRPDADAAAP
jgi:general nucleoside transport system ATP-binding protein